MTTHARRTAKDGPPTNNLPGYREVNNDLMDRVLKEVEEIETGSTSQESNHIMQLGQLVIDRFFDGNLETTKRLSRRHATYRELAKRLTSVSYSYLAKTVRVAIQRPTLPKACQQGLTAAHQMLLLSIKDDEARNQLAEKALKERLSKRGFEDCIKAWKSEHTDQTTHRRPKSALDQLLKHTAAAVTVAETRIDDLFADNTPDAEVEEAHQKLSCQLAVLNRLRDQIAYTLHDESSAVLEGSRFVSPGTQTAGHLAPTVVGMAATGDDEQTEPDTNYSAIDSVDIPESEEELIEVQI